MRQGKVNLPMIRPLRNNEAIRASKAEQRTVLPKLNSSSQPSLQKKSAVGYFRGGSTEERAFR